MKIFHENWNLSQANSFIPVCCSQSLVYKLSRNYIYLGQLCYLPNSSSVAMIIKTQNGTNREEIRNFSINFNYINEETEAQRGSMTAAPLWLPGPTLFP